MKLDTTTRKLEVLLAGTVSTTACPVVVCYRDENRNAPQNLGAVPSATQAITVSSVTVSTFLSAPSVNTIVRVPERITFKNADTGSVIPTFRLNDNATTYQFVSPQLLTGESVFYEEGRGWYAMDAFGNIKQVTASTFTSLTVTGLLDISATGAGQIKFPATQNPSSNANTLDDYEEGTWTPTDASGAALTFTSPDGTYEKIGRQFRAGCSLTYPVTADGSAAVIGSLPFTLSASASARQGFITYSNAGTAASMLPVNSGTTFSIDTVAGGAITNTQLSTSGLLATVLSHV